MPNLNFVGKNKVVNHHREVSFRFLEKKYGSSENMIIHGDNLLALRSLLATHRGKIKCIYIDPPYNTGNENWIYNDNVNDPEIKTWIGKVVGDEETDLNRHDKWLCMMYPRLRLLQELLSDDGAIFISIDDNEVANLKLICDEIFGSHNFLAMLSRRSMHTVRNSSKDFNKNTDYVLVYAKSKSKISSDKDHLIREQVDKSSNYRFNDNDGRGFYKLDPIYARNYAKPYIFQFKNGIIWSAPEGSYPRYSIETLRQMESENRLNFDGKSPRAKRYLNEVQQGQPPDTFLNPDKVGFNSDGTKTLANVLGIDKAFNQPKPVQLIKYLISIIPKNENGIILDAFAGSGTTAQSVIELNREDSGSRKFILIELMDYCESITAERVRRVGGDFSFYELGDPIFIEDQLNPNLSRDLLRRYLYFSETKKEIPPMNPDEPTLLGIHDGIAYHLIDGDLNFNSLAQIKTRSESYIIYAESCTISQETRDQFKIYFRKIPRDIRRI